MAVDIANGINWYVVFLFSTSCHEAAHAWMASKLGDDTARLGGQVTLDPTPHIRRAPFGMVVVPILSYLSSGSLLGWAHAPYNVEWAKAYPRRCAAMALAGPTANVLMALLALVLMRVGCEWGVLQVRPSTLLHECVTAKAGVSGFWTFAANILGIAFRLNVLLAVLNLLPLPPLDGSNLPLFLLPRDLASRFWDAIHAPSATWIGMMVAYRLLNFVLPPAYAVAAAAARIVCHV
jgi:Zn-dependent protease